MTFPGFIGDFSGIFETEMKECIVPQQCGLLNDNLVIFETNMVLSFSTYNESFSSKSTTNIYHTIKIELCQNYLYRTDL